MTSELFQLMLDAMKRVVKEDDDGIGEISVGAIEDCIQAIAKAEEAAEAQACAETGRQS